MVHQNFYLIFETFLALKFPLMFFLGHHFVHISVDADILGREGWVLFLHLRR